MIRLAILSSSRADFGIYLPMLRRLQEHKDIVVDLIVFGTHLSKNHGHTIEDIYQEGFEAKYKIVSMLQTDDPESIATAYALTSLKFSGFWCEHHNDFDVVFCLGDRYEMAAAVNAGIPFNIKFAHLYGGETTLGAIDNIYRNQISLASHYHYVSLEKYAERVQGLVGDDAQCIVIGSLSLENLDDINLLNLDDFSLKWKIDLSIPTILTTVHPETVAYDKNAVYAEIMYNTLSELCDDHQIVISMPNADTNGVLFRLAFEKLKKRHSDRIHLVENFGSQGYLSCMKHCDFLLGNTSSGIIEAASFGKYVINLGDRQKGRITGENVLHTPFNRDIILSTVRSISGKRFDGLNIYQRSWPSRRIIEDLRRKLSTNQETDSK